MRELFFRSLKPPGQLWFLALICLTSFTFFSFFASELLNNLYGFDLMDDTGLLQKYDQPYVVAANKLLLLIQHLGLFILPALLFNQIFSFKKKPGFLFWGEPIKPLTFILVIGLMLFSSPLINFLVALNEKMQLPAFLGGVEKDIKTLEEGAGELTYFLVKASNIGELLVNLLIMAVIPAIGEEFLFRGTIQKIVARWSGNVHLAIWTSAILFSALHFQFYGFIPRMALGALFGYILIWTGNIWYAVIAHFLNNAVSVLIYYFIQNGQLAKQTETFGSSASQAAFFVIPFILLLMVMIRKSAFGRYKGQYLSHPLLVFRKREEEPDDEFTEEKE